MIFKRLQCIHPISLFYAKSGSLGPMGFHCIYLFCRTQDVLQCIMSLQCGADFLGKSNFFSIIIRFCPNACILYAYSSLIHILIDSFIL